MPEPEADYYEILQISPNAEQETIQRVFRLFARRFHPDNPATGNETQFRLIQEAYQALNDPDKRAQYDVVHDQLRKDRIQFAADAATPENNFQMEAQTRLAVLEVLYTSRRLDPQGPGVFHLDLEGMTGRPREHLAFTIWYLGQKGLVERGDNSRLGITAKGVDYLEENYEANLQRKRIAQGTLGDA